MSKYSHLKFNDWKDPAKSVKLDIRMCVYKYRGDGAATEPNIIDELQNWIDSNEKLCALTTITVALDRRSHD